MERGTIGIKLILKNYPEKRSKNRISQTDALCYDMQGIKRHKKDGCFYNPGGYYKKNYFNFLVDLIGKEITSKKGVSQYLKKYKEGRNL